MRRISVVGNTGSGKSTLARRLARRLGVRHVELDGLFHRAGWRPLPEDALRARVATEVEADAWVIDGNYAMVRELVWARADTIVWLDYPRSVVMRRVVARTIRRVLTREVLWNGNREPFRNLASLDPERSVIAWAWARHHVYREQYGALMSEPRWSALHWIRLTSPAAADAFLASPPTGEA